MRYLSSLSLFHLELNAFITTFTRYSDKDLFQKNMYCEKLTTTRNMEVELYKTKLSAAALETEKAVQEKLQLQNEVN